MSVEKSLTNEKLNDRFENPFALVNYAITLAKSRIARGEDIDSNPVNEVLMSIAKGEDLLIEEEDEEELEGELRQE